MRALNGVAGILLIVLQFVGLAQEASLQVAARAGSSRSQDTEDQPRRPAGSKTILAVTRDLQKAVKGTAFVRNRCHAQGKELEIEEAAEIVEANQCNLVVRVRKTTRIVADLASTSKNSQPAVEFTLYADLSALTTPVLVETQKFAQCDARGIGVLKVSSRSDPKKPLQVVRRSQTQDSAKAEQGAKQSRRDLSLFFGDRTAAERTAEALTRAVKACGGTEWPDEDDLP